jgi:hypothetical protein
MAGRRGGWFGFVVGAAVILALLWIGYWFVARYAAETALARVNGGPVGGASLACSEPAVSGFPLVLDIRCGRITYAAAGDGLTAALGGLAATAPLYWPGALDARLDAPLVVNAPAHGLALTTSWSVGSASASAGLGGLRGFGASFVGLRAENAGNLPRVPLASVAAAEASAGIAPAGGNSYTIGAAAQKLHLVRTDGFAYPEADAEARVTALDVAGSLGKDPARTFLDWLRRGGTARIDRLKVAAAGAIVTSDGALRLSPEGLLNGSLLLRWNNIGALADLIEAIMPGTREKVEVPLQALNALSVTVDTPDGQLRQTALTFTDGVTWLGIIPLPIDPIPPIRF